MKVILTIAAAFLIGLAVPLFTNMLYTTTANKEKIEQLDASIEQLDATVAGVIETQQVLANALQQHANFINGIITSANGAPAGTTPAAAKKERQRAE